MMCLCEGWGCYRGTPVGRCNTVQAVKWDLYKYRCTDVPLYVCVCRDSYIAAYTDACCLPPKHTSAHVWTGDRLNPFLSAHFDPWEYSNFLKLLLQTYTGYTNNVILTCIIWIYFSRDSKVYFIIRSEIPWLHNANPFTVSSLFKSSLWEQHLDLH